MIIDTHTSREHLLHFLEKNKIGVLATVSPNGTPHAATIYTTHDPDLNIYFVAKANTQKSRNLGENQHAAIATYDASTQSTVQAEGTVIEVTDPHKTQWILNDIWHTATQTSPNSPPPPAQLTAGKYVVYKLVTPKLRMATFMHQDPADYDKIFETIDTQPHDQFNAYNKDSY